MNEWLVSPWLRSEKGKLSEYAVRLGLASKLLPLAKAISFFRTQCLVLSATNLSIYQGKCQGHATFFPTSGHFLPGLGKHPVRALKSINSKVKVCHMDIYGVNREEFKKKLLIEKPFIH